MARVPDRVAQILALVPAGLPAPEVIAEGEDATALDWDLGHDRSLSLTVCADALGHSALIGKVATWGREPYAGGPLPPIAARLLREVTQTR